jgi:single-stranded DNA-binding protein
VAVDTKDSDAWCTVLCFEDLAPQLADLRKGTEIYAKGRLKADLYTPQGGEPRVSLTLLASHVEPLVLERSKRQAPRKAVVYGDGEPFDDALA